MSGRSKLRHLTLHGGEDQAAAPVEVSGGECNSQFRAKRSDDSSLAAAGVELTYFPQTQDAFEVSTRAPRCCLVCSAVPRARGHSDVDVGAGGRSAGVGYP